MLGEQELDSEQMGWQMLEMQQEGSWQELESQGGSQGLGTQQTEGRQTGSQTRAMQGVGGQTLVSEQGGSQGLDSQQTAGQLLFTEQTEEQTLGEGHMG